MNANEDRIADLARRHIEDLLDGSGRAELEALLNGDDAARRAFVREMRLHASLRLHLGGIGRGAALSSEAPPGGRRLRLWLGLSGAAAALLAGTAFLTLDRGGHETVSEPERIPARPDAGAGLREVRLGRGGLAVRTADGEPTQEEAGPRSDGDVVFPRPAARRLQGEPGEDAKAPPSAEGTPPPPPGHLVLPRVPEAVPPSPDRRSGSALAHLVRVQGGVRILDRGVLTDAREGLAVAADQQIRSEGRASHAIVRYADGSELRLGPGTAVELLDPERQSDLRAAPFGKGVRLAAGRLTVLAAAQPSGKPLLLVTDHADVEVLGTRLTLSLHKAATRVEVWEGRVRATRRPDGDSVLVSSGQAAVLSPSNPPQAVSLATDGAALWLRLDEVAGHVPLDQSGACRDVRLEGGEWSPRGGRVRGALELNGRSDYVAVRDYAEVEGRELSCSAWVFARARPKNALIVRTGEGAKAGQLRFGLNGGVLGASLRRGDGTVLQVTEGKNTPFPLDRWQHVAVAVDGTEVRLYRNGREVARRAFNGTLGASRTLLTVGGAPAFDGAPASREPSRFWHGMLDEVRLYRRALSAEEIEALADGAW